jgi:hypothetical protein
MTIASAALANPSPDFTNDALSRELIALLSGGGDARIVLDPQTGLNKYLSAPYPRTTTAFASSTANDISPEAFAFLKEQGVPEDYGAALEAMRARIRTAYGLDERVQIVFAPSGTDLEYVALTLAASSQHAIPNNSLDKEQNAGGVHNILLGADEVGRGCIHSAHGRFFAEETALGFAVEPAQAVPGLGSVTLADIPLRCAEGQPLTSAQICEQIDAQLAIANASNSQGLLHVVHGSKTGLILPELAHIDALKAHHGDRLSLVIDACQARITSEAIHDYLGREAIVFLTGSKFMGGPPFSGFALVPASLSAKAERLPEGFAQIFRGAEWPETWPGHECLENSDNIGLALRLSAAIFELERFQALPQRQVQTLIECFRKAVTRNLIAPLGLSMVEPYAPGERASMKNHPVEMQTLITVDVSSLPCMTTFDDAQKAHRLLAEKGIRLGQPVKSVRVGGEWAGTLRVGLSMPQLCRWAELEESELKELLASEFSSIAQALASLSD